jgi:hypothetical protein
LGFRADRPSWDELMHRLGYDRMLAQGRDVGAAVTDAMAGQTREGPARLPNLNYVHEVTTVVLRGGGAVRVRG